MVGWGRRYRPWLILCVPVVGLPQPSLRNGICVERICCLTARLTSSVEGPGFVKVLGSSEHEGARRSEVGKSVIDAFKGWPLRPY